MKAWILAILSLALMALSCSLWQPYAGIMQAPTQEPTRTPEPTQAPTHSPTFPSLSCFVTAAESLNLRTGPGISFQVIDWLKPGDHLTITQQLDGWAQVVTPTGAAGWVNLIYCAP